MVTHTAIKYTKMFRKVQRGRCKFIQYMPSKPAKYGIKIWVCCDAKTKYVYNMPAYTAAEKTYVTAGQTTDLGGKVVRKLLEPMNCEGRNVTTDNYFTSLSLARYLLKKKMKICLKPLKLTYLQV